MFKWYDLKDEAENEATTYFNQHIKVNGTLDSKTWDNNIDAFRHAYVSGRYVQSYNEFFARLVGDLWELQGNGYGSFSSNPQLSKRMDLWNNKVGRQYGKKTKATEKLGKFLHDALKRGELVIDLSDPRIQHEEKLKDESIVFLGPVLRVENDLYLLPSLVGKFRSLETQTIHLLAISASEGSGISKRFPIGQRSTSRPTRSADTIN